MQCATKVALGINRYGVPECESLRECVRDSVIECSESESESASLCESGLDLSIEREIVRNNEWWHFRATLGSLIGI